MIRSSAPGRIVLAAAIAAFGILALLHAASAALPALGPPWPATGPLLGVMLGVALVALGLGLVIPGWEVRAAGALSAVLFVAACLVQLPALAAAPRAPNPWTGLGELLCLAGGALALAGALLHVGASPPSSPRAAGAAGTALTAGRLLYALPLIIFGVQHFMYARFVANLVPAWMPARLFWAIFVGAAFIAAALSLATGVQARLAGTLLGAMFLLWVLILHLPRSFAAAGNGNEWTSTFVALAMGGSAWILAAAPPASWPGRAAAQSRQP